MLAFLLRSSEKFSNSDTGFVTWSPLARPKFKVE